MKSRRFQLVAPPYTPMHGDGRLNLPVIETYARVLADQGVDAVFVGGSTGEGQQLSTAERMELADAWVAAGAVHGLAVLVHVGHNCQADACQMARHAADMGVAGISCLAPYYVKPATASQLVEFCRPIAEAGGDAPFYFYHIPQLTGVHVRMCDFMPLAADRIRTFAGIKYTDNDLVDLQLCLRMATDNCHIYYGWDEALLAGLTLGVHGAIGSSYNYMARHYRALISAYDRGDMTETRRLQMAAVDMIILFQRYGYMAASKAAMALLGCDCGPVRAPLQRLDSTSHAKLLHELSMSSFFGGAMSAQISRPNSAASLSH